MNSIKQIDYEAESPEVPEPFASLIQDADDRWEKFWSQKLNKRYPRYVASEPAQVYAALRHVRDEGLALGERFIEWGSGFGVATSLAAQLGFEATGIELEDGLVAIAESLAEKHQTGAEFIATTYIPEGYISYDHVGGSDIVPDESFGHQAEPPRYDGMDIGLNEIDIFFVYPWPGEQEMMLKLFQSVASEDAILIAYYGDGEICIYRKQ
tara:strand:+ start:166 stop:795 length:630 start_codon:yes stop_codon:yes gene_type:complete